MIPEEDAVRKFQQVLGRVDPRLVLDRGNIRYMSDPYPGVEFGLRLGDAGVLLFMPEADLAAGDWETRMFKRMEAARHYLEGFPLAKGTGATGPHPGSRTPPRPSRIGRT